MFSGANFNTCFETDIKLKGCSRITEATKYNTTPTSFRQNKNTRAGKTRKNNRKNKEYSKMLNGAHL